MKIESWLKENTNDLTGKTVAVTGSTGGLGRYVCQYLAGLGANLILLDRNEKRSTEHAETLKKSYFGTKIDCVNVDMVDIFSVKSACEKLKDRKIDYLILNAGAYSLPREKSSAGWDNVFQINFVSPYLMVKRLIPNLKGGKVVVVGSIAHKYSHINGNDVDFSCVKQPRKVYGNAKRFLMFSLSYLLEKENIPLSIAHPGITPTNITSHYPKFISALIKYPMKMIFTSPKKASLNIIKAVFYDCKADEWIAPRGSGIWGKPKVEKLNTCSKEEQLKIYELAEKIYKGVESMKEHELGLQSKYYDLIMEGVKIYEGRLNDEKRRAINVGDVIIFKRDPERRECFKARVKSKQVFKDFEEMASVLPVKEIGFEGKSASEVAEIYLEFYPIEKQKENGVLAIEVEKI